MVSLIIYTILIGLIILIIILTFSMIQVAGRYDDVSERIYFQELDKLERHKKMMREADENPEHIDTLDKK
jgi:uncharacterized ion transporter superfamily protein YfcC